MSKIGGSGRIEVKRCFVFDFFNPLSGRRTANSRPYMSKVLIATYMLNFLLEIFFFLYNLHRIRLSQTLLSIKLFILKLLIDLIRWWRIDFFSDPAPNR